VHLPIFSSSSLSAISKFGQQARLHGVVDGGHCQTIRLVFRPWGLVANSFFQRSVTSVTWLVAMWPRSEEIRTADD